MMERKQLLTRPDHVVYISRLRLRPPEDSLMASCKCNWEATGPTTEYLLDQWRQHVADSAKETAKG
jgi:hypothetical protein